MTVVFVLVSDGERAVVAGLRDTGRRRSSRRPGTPWADDVRDRRRGPDRRRGRDRRPLVDGDLDGTVDRPGDALPDPGECLLVLVQPALVPVGEDVVFEARVVGLGETVDEGRVDVAVRREHDRREPLDLQAQVRADLGLGLDEPVAVHVEAVLVRALAVETAVRVHRRDRDEDRVIEEIVDRRRSSRAAA